MCLGLQMPAGMEMDWCLGKRRAKTVIIRTYFLFENSLDSFLLVFYKHSTFDKDMNKKTLWHSSFKLTVGFAVKM